MVLKKFDTVRENGIFTDSFIEKGSLLFSGADWVEDEVYGWEILSVSDVEKLTVAEKAVFLKYSYDIDFDRIIGTFDMGRVKHISNFMNHSCRPNMVYDEHNNIIAKRDIEPSEELTIDYGNFIVNFDQDFTCACGSPGCRSRIYKNDWHFLAGELGFNFPVFMHPALKEMLSGLNRALPAAGV